MKLTLLRGLPGSGKSTLALKMVGDAQRNMEDMVRLEADLFHTMQNGDYVYKRELARYAHQFCQSTAAFYLNKGTDVVVANTFITKDECLPYFKIAKILDAELELIVCDGNYQNIHNVPRDVVDSMISRWEDFTLADLIGYAVQVEKEEAKKAKVKTTKRPWWKFGGGSQVQVSGDNSVSIQTGGDVNIHRDLGVD